MSGRRVTARASLLLLGAGFAQSATLADDTTSQATLNLQLLEERLLHALPEELSDAARRVLLVELLVWQVHVDPYGVLEDARHLRVDDPLRDITLRNIAREWVLIDPPEVIRNADRFSGRARATWLTAALSAWAELDPEGLMDYLERRAIDLHLAAAAFPILSSAEFINRYRERIIQVAAQFPIYYRVALERRALFGSVAEAARPE